MVDYDGEHTIMTIKEMKAQCPHYSLPNQNRKWNGEEDEVVLLSSNLSDFPFAQLPPWMNQQHVEGGFQYMFFLEWLNELIQAVV